MLSIKSHFSYFSWHLKNKQMKKYILILFAMSLIVSCSQVNSTTSNGFGPRDFPITMGSQSSVDVVIAMDNPEINNLPDMIKVVSEELNIAIMSLESGFVVVTVVVVVVVSVVTV